MTTFSNTTRGRPRAWRRSLTSAGLVLATALAMMLWWWGNLSTMQLV